MKPWPDQSRRLFVHCICLAMGGVALAYLVFKMAQAGVNPGYDLRFFWLAGQLWNSGVDPYAEGYQAFGANVILQGNVPEIWTYPPNIYPLAAILGLADLSTASWMFSVLNLVWLLAGCLMCARVAADQVAASPEGGTGWPYGATHLQMFSVLLFLMATLEGVAITITVGQTSLLMFFGASLLLYGIARHASAYAIVGLAILCIKPQIGVPFILFVALTQPNSIHVILGSAVLSLLMAAPALFVSIWSPVDWLHNVAIYDSAFPQGSSALAMTGLRILATGPTGVDIGSIPAMTIALATVLILLFVFRRNIKTARDSTDGGVVGIGLTAVTLIALAPLHLYDLVLVGVAVPFFLTRMRRWSLLPILLGAALMWRAQGIADFTGFHSPEAIVFSGSRLAAIGGAGILAGAVWMLLDRRAAMKVQ